MSKQSSELYDLLGPFTGVPNRVFRILPHLGHKAFILYVCLRYHAGKDEVIFPSYGLINAEAGLHRRDIAKAIRTLETFGLMERKRRFGNSTVYKLLYLTPEDLQMILDKHGDPLNKAKAISSNGGTNVHSSSNDGTKDSSNGGTSISSNGGTLTRLNKQDSSSNKTQFSNASANTRQTKGKPSLFDQSTPEGRSRLNTVKAMQRGSARRFELEIDIQSNFHINPNWDRKSNKAFMEWLMGLPESQTIDQFARWWKENDWRGQRGQPPTLDQIHELWPQAFINQQPSQPQSETEAELAARKEIGKQLLLDYQSNLANTKLDRQRKAEMVQP